jgi:rare lipoprotein A
MTKSRRARLGIRALTIGIPAAAAAMAAGQAFASPAQAPLHIHSRSGPVAYGHDLVVTGTETSSDTGHTVVLEFARRGASAWSQLGSATIDGAGTFQVAARLNQSGVVRVLDASSGSLTPFVAHPRGDHSGGAATSSPVPVDVAAGVRVPSRGINVLAGQAVQLRGRLLPAARGRKVSLQARRSGVWHTVATARTGSAGRFVLRYTAGSAGEQPIRVRFAGDQLNARSTASAGQLTVFRAAGASWYNDGGNTACGFHAGDGVANRTLPCGTKVVFRYGGRTVTATVDDRGPFVGGRDWDLNQNTAGALGFGGVGEVWSSQ